MTYCTEHIAACSRPLYTVMYRDNTKIGRAAAVPWRQEPGGKYRQCCLLAEVAKDADGGGEHLDIVQRLKCATLPLIAVLQYTENNLIKYKLQVTAQPQCALNTSASKPASEV